MPKYEFGGRKPELSAKQAIDDFLEEDFWNDDQKSADGSADNSGYGNLNETSEKSYRPQDKEKLKGQLNDLKKELADTPYVGRFGDVQYREDLKERMTEIIDGLLENDIEEVVFLDKSARLLGWFFKKAWQAELLDRPQPGISFVNIGVEKPENGLQWGIYPRLDPDEITDALDQDPQEIWQIFGEKFDGKRIAIIDEFGHEGGSLVRAIETFKRAYPDAEIYGEWFHVDEAMSRSLPDLNRLIKENRSYDSLPERLFLTGYSGVTEPADKRALLAKSWTKTEKLFETKARTKEEISREDFIRLLKEQRRQIAKLALEMMPEE